MRRAGKHVALIVIYVAVALFWLYEAEGFGWTLAFAAFHVAVGAVGRSWWYVLLPAVLGPLAIRTEDSVDAGPGWAWALYLGTPIGAFLIALGVGAVRVLESAARSIRRPTCARHS